MAALPPVTSMALRPDETPEGQLLATIEKQSKATGITIVPTADGMVSRSLQSITTDIVNARTFGVASNADGSGIKKAIDYAVSTNSKVVFNFDAVIKIPSHATSLSTAINSVTGIGNRKFTLLIESEHQPTSGLTLDDGDYSNFTIAASDPVVKLSPTFSGRFIAISGGAAPILSCYIDANGSNLDRIYSVINGRGYVSEGCGGRGALGRPLYANNSSIYAQASVWRDFGDSLYASAGSAMQLGSAVITGGLVTANGSLVASRGSSIEAQKLTMSNCKTGFECKRAGAAINAHEATISNIGTGFLARASRGAIISLSESTITDVSGNGFEALDAGVISFGENASMTASANNNQTGVRAIGGIVALGNSTVKGFGVYNLEARSGGLVSGEYCKVLDSKDMGAIAYRGGKVLIYAATVTGSTNNDIRVLDGGELNIRGGTTSTGTVGSPNLADSNLVDFGGFNTSATSGRGIIWA